MKLIVQPNDGMAPLIKAIKRAKKSIEIVIFRFDELAIERALIDAAQRGVFVHALIAFTNRGGEKNLRNLEMRFLAKGITVARTSAKLVVSPANARQRLGAFLKGAKRELLIYDIKISDRPMVRILEERKKKGVDVRIIGHVAKSQQLTARSLRSLRLHARVIIRDRRQAFIGSQSLRKVELDQRREVGVIVGSSRIVNALTAVFENDWKSASVKAAKRRYRDVGMMWPDGKPKALAKVVAKKIPVAPVVRQVAHVIHQAADVELDRKEVRETVEQAVKSALKKAVKKATAEVVHRASEMG